MKKYAKTEDGETVILGDFISIPNPDGTARMIDSTCEEARSVRESQGFALMEIDESGNALPDVSKIDNMTVRERTGVLKNVVKILKGEE